jgi:uncharacterized caspase-like protein
MLHAVVIGIDAYADPEIAQLRFAAADAKGIARLLQERIEPSELSLRLVLDAEATRLGIITAIGEELPRRHHSDDLVLVYFAGHGSPEHAAPPDRIARYLVPHDADRRRIFATGIGLEDELLRLFDRQSAQRVLFVLDSCFSGQAGGRTFVGAALRRELSAFRSGRVSLRPLELGFGRVFITACRDDEVAREDADYAHGVFTYHLLNALTRPGEPVVSVAALYDDVYGAVYGATKGAQRPVIRGEMVGLSLPRLH